MKDISIEELKRAFDNLDANSNNKNVSVQNIQEKEGETIIYSFAKNTTEEVKCKVFSYQGHQCLAMSVHDITPFGPSRFYKSSICMHLDTWRKHLPFLVEALQNTTV